MSFKQKFCRNIELIPSHKQIVFMENFFQYATNPEESSKTRKLILFYSFNAFR